jgi:hypothetical protein
MKSLAAGIVLIVLLGVAGFFYRNVMERSGEPEGIACTMEAKMCPDGSAVGRSGPKCEFATCPLPNAEDKELGIAFAIPEGYAANADAIGPDLTLRAVFDKGTSTLPNNIIIRAYPIPEGKTVNDVIIGKTTFEPADMGAESISQFKSITIAGRTYQSVVVERFEAQVHSLYYLAREKDVLRFEVLERAVMDWMEPTLAVADLPEHKALLSLLASLETN